MATKPVSPTPAPTPAPVPPVPAPKTKPFYPLGEGSEPEIPTE